ncbi:CBS domain-containing protein [Streptomyces sasae]|uniref:CBS domain-containing protein n=1 Tax=Streptomyces sasae TaxID=1266772 RepID=UPI00293022D3|nr:CBS domain-containing protein [Streptomyces sasae]
MTGTPYAVSDVMTRTVVAVRRGAAFKDIVKTMRGWRVSAVPVLDDQGRVMGVVSEADLLHKEEVRDGAPEGPARPRRPDDLTRAAATTAGELMTAPAVTVRADATLPQAARRMARHGVKRLPVVDADGVLTGVVSRVDLLKVYLRDDEDIAEEIRREVLPNVFADTSEPVEVRVSDGVVTLTGRVRDPALVQVVAGWVRSVDGVVDVDCALTGARRQPAAGAEGVPRS